MNKDDTDVEEKSKSFMPGHYRRPHSVVVPPSEHPLRPGYFEYEGNLLRMTRHAGKPQRWNGKNWVWMDALAKFVHGAMRISHKDAAAMAKHDNFPGDLPELK